jgi:hypothetical protein
LDQHRDTDTSRLNGEHQLMDSTVTPQNQPIVSATSRVPPELIDAIIDAGKDDKPFLKTCGLVSRAWIPPSRRRLFKRVTLNNGNAVGFGHLVQSELVTITRYIRYLEIRKTSYECASDNFLSQLTVIKDLLLNHINFIGRIGSLDHGIRYFRSLTRLCISRCCFDSFNDLANVLRSCIILEDLSLAHTTWLHASESVPVGGSLGPSLRHLAIRFISFPEDVIAWLLLLQPVPALHSFTFHSSARMENPGQVNTLLQTLGPSLRHLDIRDAVSCSCTLLAI